MLLRGIMQSVRKFLTCQKDLVYAWLVRVVVAACVLLEIDFFPFSTEKNDFAFGLNQTRNLSWLKEQM